ncbi:SIMPL domain-containing protein [Oceanisphaera avium]|uniref:Oxidative stress defense protein n=1 Tax=Oceanisphaera avium TaxID=1903694 RepID=A0A1Y0CVA5_9GAMM|nr:SIMPL domain-containing protein [Oceanisphaera avium]ART78944.1 hypothetical protein CBP12_01265 [Oceanisphaera avium]
MRIITVSSLLVPLLFSSSVWALALPDKPHLVIQGQSEIKVAPDMATIRLMVTALKPEALAAKEEVDTKVAALFSQLAALGLTKKDIDSASVITRPEYQYNKDQESPTLVGYHGERHITLRLYDLDKLSATLNTVLEQGIQNIQQVSYDSQQASELQKQARSAAVMNARTQAEELADAAQRKLGEVYSIDYQPQRLSSPRPYGLMNAKMADSEQRDASYVQNDIEFSDQVQMVFLLN